MKKLSALLASILAVVSAVSIFLLSACKSDPETATQKDMLKYSPFSCEFSVGGESNDFKLTLNKDNTYSLYIKDYENSTSDNTIMKTYTGTWSHVLTYEYEYRAFINIDSVFTKKKTDVLGIYLLEGYQRWNYKTDSLEYSYFGYHKSSGSGELFSTNKTVNEAYLESCRSELNKAIPSGLGIVDLDGINFKSEK